MSWVNDEANENVEVENKEAHRQEVLMRSGYWAALVKQVEQDVRLVNEHDYWKKKLAGFPLRFGPPTMSDGNTYQITKSGFPAVLVEFQHRSDYIQVARRFTENPLSRQREFLPNEKLIVGVMGNSVTLTNPNNETFVVPEDASRYLMKAIIESLKITPS
jgi:hypothetical protein